MNPRTLPVVVAAALAALVARPAPADACTPYTLYDVWPGPDPSHADDLTPPSQPSAHATIYHDPDAGVDVHCGGGCGRPSSIDVDATAIDDRADPTELYYELRLVDGTPPPGLDLPAEPIRPENEWTGDAIHLLFDDDGGGFAFKLEIRAVDLNGNRGPPVVVDVVGAERVATGCATSRGRGPATTALLITALALARRRRRPAPARG